MALRRNIGGLTNADMITRALGTTLLSANPHIMETLIIAPGSALPKPGGAVLTQYPIESPVTNEIPTAAVVQMETAVVPAPDAPADVDTTLPPAVGKRGLVIGAVATAVAVYALSRNGKGAGSVDVHVTHGKPRSMLFPILLVGGAAAYYWYTNMRTASGTPVPVNTQMPVTTPPITTTTPPATTTQTQPPPLQAAPDVVAAAQAAVSNPNLAALNRDWPAVATTIAKMSPAEINTMYQYFYSFVVQGLKLYRLPNATGIFADGGWNTQLYDQVMAINKKYNINTL